MEQRCIIKSAAARNIWYSLPLRYSISSKDFFLQNEDIISQIVSNPFPFIEYSLPSESHTRSAMTAVRLLKAFSSFFLYSYKCFCQGGESSLLSTLQAKHSPGSAPLSCSVPLLMVHSVPQSCQGSTQHAGRMSHYLVQLNRAAFCLSAWQKQSEVWVKSP